jgi:hypothetical protein
MDRIFRGEAWYWNPLGVITGAQVCPELGYEEEDLVWGAWFPCRLPLERTSRI